MPKSDNSSFRGRLKRYASVSASAAHFGARAAGARLLGGGSRAGRAEKLRIALGGLKGPLMKVAQIVSSVPDLVPKEYAAELAQLQADAPSMGWSFVKRRMAAELGADWENKFKRFSREASAAASLGQVHQAVSHDGRLLACKLQYPDMKSVVEADLKQLKLILAFFDLYDRAVSTAGVQKEIADRLHEELDYAREARHIRLYGRMHAQTKGVHVPEPLEELSTDRLLTMTWLDGERLADVALARPLKERNAVAANLFRAWYTPFYSYGVIHGDPHLGNYTARKDGSINLLDFGCIRIFRPELVKAVIMLYEALRDGHEDRAVEAYKIWGFSKPTKKLVEVLNLWAKFIYAPLLHDSARPLEETNSSLYGRETAMKVHAELRKIGGVEVPREFVFMDRASIGLGGVFLRLNAEVNWHRLFEGMTKDFDLREVAKNQKSAMKACGLYG